MMVERIHTPEWRLVPDFPDYEVSDIGGIVRRATNHPSRPKTYPAGHVMAQWLVRRLVQRKDGNVTDLSYLSVTLYNPCRNAHRNILTHRIVACAFLGNPPTPRHQVAHGDGNRFNNSLGNLRWATPKENKADQIAHGTVVWGSRHGRAKLNEKDIIEIRALLWTGMSQAAVASKFNVAQASISMINTRRIWKHV